MALRGRLAAAYLHAERRRAGLVIPYLAFSRIVREIAYDFKRDLEFDDAAIWLLAEAAQARLVGLLEGAVLCMRHGKRAVLWPMDIQLASRLA